MTLVHSFLRSIREAPGQAAAAAVLLALSLYLGVFWHSSERVPGNRNALLLGSRADLDEVKVPVIRPREMNSMSLEEILQFRTSLVEARRELLARPYRPWEQVFRRLQPGLPWMSLAGVFVHGPSTLSTTGVSSESRAIFNPYLLLMPEVWGLSIWGDRHLEWKPEAITAQRLTDPSFPFYPRPSGLVFHPKARTAEVSYNVSQFLLETAELIKTPIPPSDIEFGVSAYNARDFNLRYVQLLLDKSSEIENRQQPKEPQFIIDYLLASSTYCGNPEGCNHRNPYVAAFTKVRIKSLPAVAVFGLWRYKPTNPDFKPELTFTMKFN